MVFVKVYKVCEMNLTNFSKTVADKVQLIELCIRVCYMKL